MSLTATQSQRQIVSDKSTTQSEKKRLLSLDTETTGVDFYHGARPFFVTMCREDGEQLWWEWDVDPLTREPKIPAIDLAEVRREIDAAEVLVMQNGKFDVRALTMAGLAGDFPWGKVQDTLVAGHVLASNQFHKLTSMLIHYLGIDIQPLEDDLKKAVLDCRRMVQQAKLRVKRAAEKGDGPWLKPSLFEEEPLSKWAIAQQGRPDMPSAKGDSGREERGAESEKPWKLDMWLPRTLALHLGHDEDHDWFRVVREYSNGDSAGTLALWKVQEAELHRRGLWEIYRARMRVIPIVSRMEDRGITLSETRLDELIERFTRESEEAARRCVLVAKSYDYDLKLPKSGNNKSLTEFCFGQDQPCPECGGSGWTSGKPFEGPSCGYCAGLGKGHKKRWLNLPVVGTTDTGNPSLNVDAMDMYEASLKPGSKQHLFVTSLRAKRKRDTAVTYMHGYKRFWRPWVPAWPGSVDPVTGAGWWVLNPSLNPTGTSTLRFSCSNPNEQNISKQEGFNLRYCFGPAPGREWWSHDAKNIELRIPSYEANEEELVALFERPDDPPYYGSQHLLNFHTVFPDLWERGLKEVGFEKVGPYCKKKYVATHYQDTKNGGFCKMYGGQRELTDATFRRAGAFDLIDSRLTRIAGLSQAQIRYAERHGYVETIPDKTVNPKRGYPIMCTRTEYGRIKPTVPFNYHVQGTAMWWTQQAMVKCQEALDEWNRAAGREDWWMIMQVHDEIVFDFPRRADPRKDPKRSNLGRARELARLMASCGDDLVIRVPTPVNVEYHPDNWSSGVTFAA